MGLVGGLWTTTFAWLALRANFALTNVGVLAGGLMAIAASWGLGRRREWARQSFIGVQIYGFVVMCTRALFPQLLYRGVKFPENFPPEMRDVALRQARSAATLSLVPAFLIGAFVVYKLMSRRVREEFQAQD